MKTWMWLNTLVILSSLPVIAVSQRMSGVLFIAGAISTCLRLAFSDRRRR